MEDQNGYKQMLIMGVIGALAGAILVAVATKALPKIMSETAAKMMKNMMGDMGDGCTSPSEI